MYRPFTAALFIIGKSQEKKKQVSINRTMLQSYDRKLFSNKMEWTTHSYYLKIIMLSESQTKQYTWYDSIYIKTLEKVN